MKKIGSLQMILGILALFSFCSLLLVLQPAFIPLLDLSTDEASNIGSAIGGITAPVVGMFSAYLIYEALFAQLKGNEDQRLKADSDIIFLLLNQLEKDYDSFHLKQYKGEQEINISGYTALRELCYLYKQNSDMEGLYEAFERAETTSKIMYLIESFNLIKERVTLSNFTPEINDMFLRKLNMYYNVKFKFAIQDLVDTFMEHRSDATMMSIITFRDDNG